MPGMALCASLNIKHVVLLADPTVFRGERAPIAEDPWGVKPMPNHTGFSGMVTAENVAAQPSATETLI